MTTDADRYRDKIRPYTVNGTSRFAMFVEDKQTGCVEHKDVLGDTDPDEVRSELIAKLKARAEGAS